MTEKLSTEKIEELKEKYGKIYQISTMFSEDEDSEETVAASYIFHKPSCASLNRYLRTAKKNMTAATAAYLLDNVIQEQKQELQEKINEYPALPISMGEKLLEVMGLTSDTNLTRL